MLNSLKFSSFKLIFSVISEISLYGILSTLEYHGFINKDSTNTTYNLGAKLFELGLNYIVSPIKNRLGEAIAAISISTPSSRFTKEKLQDMKIELMKACEEISNSI